MATGVTITANLETIIGGLALEGARLQVTLCGFGAMIPQVAGEGLLADAGIPQYIDADDTGAVSVELYNNLAISPPGTFYCFAVLDPEDNPIQANNYQFNDDGTFDLSEVDPILAGVPTLFNEKANRTSASSYRITKLPIGVMLGVFYNGSFQQPGVNYNMNGQAINFTFVLEPLAAVNAVYMALGDGGLLLKPGITVDDLEITADGQTNFPLSRRVYQAIFIGVYYNGDFQGAEFYSLGIDLATHVESLILKFSTYLGDNLYAVYIGF